ncbi:MAG: hypothetical protein AAF750_08565 [Planctomycetota bacterium]
MGRTNPLTSEVLRRIPFRARFELRAAGEGELYLLEHNKLTCWRSPQA